jgi:hypothetical protein
MKDQYAIAGQLSFERKGVREQIAALEEEFKLAGDLLAVWGKGLKEEPYVIARNRSHPDDHETLKTTVLKLLDSLDNYLKAKEQEEVLNERLQRIGL